MGSPVDVHPDHLRIVREILRDHLPPNVNVWVFGSRAGRRARDTSDLDLALEGDASLDYDVIRSLEDAFEDSSLPWTVDTVDLNRVGDGFRRIVESQGIPLPLDDPGYGAAPAIGSTTAAPRKDITAAMTDTPMHGDGTAGSESRQLAVLIDGDNAQPSLIGHVLEEAAKHGTVTIRRVYGDWTAPQMSGWREVLHAHALSPVQQFNYTVGKNSTDGALIIDTMDILHSGKVGGICIVSSDSDYTSLARRVRENGVRVIGMGKSTTPASFKKACDIFTHTENLAQQEAVADPPDDSPGWRELVRKAVELMAQLDDWALLADVGNSLRSTDPAFDPRTYGHRKLLSLIESDPQMFETRMHLADDKPPVYHVRIRGPGSDGARQTPG